MYILNIENNLSSYEMRIYHETMLNPKTDKDVLKSRTISNVYLDCTFFGKKTKKPTFKVLLDSQAYNGIIEAYDFELLTLNSIISDSSSVKILMLDPYSNETLSQIEIQNPTITSIIEKLWDTISPLPNERQRFGARQLLMTLTIAMTQLYSADRYFPMFGDITGVFPMTRNTCDSMVESMLKLVNKINFRPLTFYFVATLIGLAESVVSSNTSQPAKYSKMSFLDYFNTQQTSHPYSVLDNVVYRRSESKNSPYCAGTLLCKYISNKVKNDLFKFCAKTILPGSHMVKGKLTLVKTDFDDLLFDSWVCSTDIDSATYSMLMVGGATRYITYGMFIEKYVKNKIADILYDNTDDPTIEITNPMDAVAVEDKLSKELSAFNTFANSRNMFNEDNLTLNEGIDSTIDIVNSEVRAGYVCVEELVTVGKENRSYSPMILDVIRELYNKAYSKLSTDKLISIMELFGKLFVNEVRRIKAITLFMNGLFIREIAKDNKALDYLINVVTGNDPELKLFVFNELILYPRFPSSTGYYSDNDGIPEYYGDAAADEIMKRITEYIGTVKDDKNKILQLAKIMLTEIDNLKHINNKNLEAYYRSALLRTYWNNREVFSTVVDDFFGNASLMQGASVNMRALAMLEFGMPQLFSMTLSTVFAQAMTSGEPFSKYVKHSSTRGIDKRWFELRAEIVSSGYYSQDGKVKHPFSSTHLYCIQDSGNRRSKIVDCGLRPKSDVAFCMIGMYSVTLMQDSLYLAMIEGLLSIASFSNDTLDTMQSCQYSSAHDDERLTIANDAFRPELLHIINGDELIGEVTKELTNICFKSTAKFKYRLLTVLKRITKENCSPFYIGNAKNLVPSENDKDNNTLSGYRIKMATAYINTVGSSFLDQSVIKYLLLPDNNGSEITAISQPNFQEMTLMNSLCTSVQYKQCGDEKFILGLDTMSMLSALQHADKCPDYVSNELLISYLSGKTSDD
jgi:hypothetical protein